MSIKVLIDMNLSPRWIEVFKNEDIVVVHWSNIGEHRAKDSILMEWAKENEHIVFTNDLDFGTLLALTQATAPSVIQMRTQNVLPEYWGITVVSVIKHYESELKKGALIVLDDRINRIRILPLAQSV